MSYKIIVRTPLDNKITLIINDISEILKRKSCSRVSLWNLYLC